MSKLKREGRESRLLYANFFILALAALLYAALGSKNAVPTLAAGGSFPVYRGTASNEVALQCTVTWDAAALEPILDMLSDEGVAVTFAVSGKWAEDNAALLQRMLADGHEIAVMGYEPNKDGGVDFVMEDVSAAVDIVERATGVRPVTYYCGSRSASTSAYAGDKLGLTTVLCTIDLDCASADADLIIKRLSGNAKAGSIINVQPTASLLSALPQITDYLKNIGSAIVPTHKMLYN